MVCELSYWERSVFSKAAGEGWRARGRSSDPPILISLSCEFTQVRDFETPYHPSGVKCSR